jgi:hypothetical protein
VAVRAVIIKFHRRPSALWIEHEPHSISHKVTARV